MMPLANLYTGKSIPFRASALFNPNAGIAGSAVSGVVTIPVIGDALGSITEDLVDKGSVDWYDVGEDATVGAAIGSLGKKTGKLEGGNACSSYIKWHSSLST